MTEQEVDAIRTWIFPFNTKKEALFLDKKKGQFVAKVNLYRGQNYRVVRNPSTMPARDSWLRWTSAACVVWNGPINTRK